MENWLVLPIRAAREKQPANNSVEWAAMRFRKLRIAWFIACVLVCQPLLLLWALSYSELNGWTMPIGRSRGMVVAIVTGRLAIGIADHPFVWRLVRNDLS